MAKRKTSRYQNTEGPEPLSRYIPYVLTSIVIIFSYLFFIHSDLLTFIAFMILIPIFVYFKHDGKIPIGFAALMLVFAAIVLSVSQDATSANAFAVFAFWLMVVGVVCLAIESMSNDKK